MEFTITRCGSTLVVSQDSTALLNLNKKKGGLRDCVLDAAIMMPVVVWGNAGNLQGIV